MFPGVFQKRPVPLRGMRHTGAWTYINASAQDGDEPIKVASACLGHATSSIPWIPVPSLFSRMALGYHTDLETSFWVSKLCLRCGLGSLMSSLFTNSAQ